MILRSRIVYPVLVAVWLVIVFWQVLEHVRVRQTSREELIINRGKDISNTAASVMNALRRFGLVPRDRLEPALKPLIRPGEVNSIALLNEAEDIVASVGDPMDASELKALGTSGEPRWTRDTVTFMNLVELGTNQVAAPGPDGSPDNERRPTIIVNDFFGRNSTNRPPPPPPEEARQSRNDQTVESGNSGGEEIRQPDSNEDRGSRRRGRRGEGGGRPRFGRPFWMSEQDYQDLLAKQGVHSFVIVLSTASVKAAELKDLWLRGVITLLAGVSVVGFGLAWRNLLRSSDLEVRLVRASELNTRLKEMNLAAAGLAHETKNPLNIVRGLAQMISRQGEASAEVRQHSGAIVEETDRVTAQLNEFINYSRPREVRRSAISLAGSVGEVTRALGYDLEEKSVTVEAQPDLPVIEADEQLLRQALFNLILNAVQAVDRGGKIWISFKRQTGNEGTLEICDDGPGVPAPDRLNIFKPYFTTNAKGTGLGLAVVHQIVLAHGWEIGCQDHSPRGARFVISHLRLAGNSRS